MIADLIDGFRNAFSPIADAYQRLGFWTPMMPTPPLFAPLVATAGLLTLALLAGVAVSALSILLVTLVLIHAILTDVFGVTIELVGG